MESKKLLTTTRMKEIIEDFLEKCDIEEIQESVGAIYSCDVYLEESHINEEDWIDDNSDDMKFSLLDNYLLQLGYHTLEEEGNVPNRAELIMNYLKK
tara:strand:- start:516 stop:806 length:291 start_codon:yes stop_codon:yes gene_type:complete